MTDTSAEALLKLAVDLDTIGPDHVMKVPTHQSAEVLLRCAATLRALAAERAQPPADVVERVARAVMVEDICGIMLGTERVLCNDPRLGERADRRCTCRETADLALSALRPGDEIPAGVVVPREPTLQMQNAGWRAIKDQGIDPETIEVWPIYDAFLSAITGAGHE